jgi:hypothetical protein
MTMMISSERSQEARSHVLPAFLFLGWIALPIIAVILNALFVSDWIIQDLPAHQGWIKAMLALVYGVVLCGLYWISLDAMASRALAMLVGGAAFGWILAGSIYNVVNSVGDSSPGQRVSVAFVEQLKGAISFKVVEGPARGVKFTCSRSAWGPLGHSTPAFEIHRGRLGLWWGKLS